MGVVKGAVVASARCVDESRRRHLQIAPGRRNPSRLSVAWTPKYRRDERLSGPGERVDLQP